MKEPVDVRFYTDPQAAKAQPTSVARQRCQRQLHHFQREAFQTLAA
jgi:hypothetical protein